jgi:pimeloyl-ACP methyl ester carboxylesterase
VTLDGNIYRAVWTEAAEWRASGELLRQAGSVQCPVTAIHGDSDPSPVSGVSQPLSGILKNFRLLMLAKCGHTPWKERYARDEFYQVLVSEIESG